MKIANKPKTLGDIPSFPISLAHDLYDKVLKPVEAGWRNATDLVVVAPGTLGQLPFALLPTASLDLGAEKDVPVAEVEAIGPRGENLAAFLNLIQANDGYRI